MSDLNQADPTVQARFRQSLEDIRAEMAALTVQELRPINVDPAEAAGVVQGSLNRIMGYREQLQKNVQGFDITKLDKLETYTIALLQSHALHKGISSSPAVVTGLAEEAKSLWETFYSDATALAKHGYFSGDNLEQLKGPFGYRDIGVALLSITNILRRSWPSVSAKTPLTEADLDRAEALSAQLLQALGIREFNPATLAKETLERQQVFTLFVNAYDQVRRAITFLRWNEGDADVIAPSLYVTRAAPHKKAESDVVEPTVPVNTSTKPTTANAVTPAGTAAPAAPVAKVAAGLPGADPFSS